MPRIRKCSAQTLAVLEVLVASPRSWRHGYELSQATSLKSGTLYPILMRLSDRGLLESKWEPAPDAGRPPRHLYRLTADGAAYGRTSLAQARQGRALARSAAGGAA